MHSIRHLLRDGFAELRSERRGTWRGYVALNVLLVATLTATIIGALVLQAFAEVLNKSTAAQYVIVGPFVTTATGYTVSTALTPTQAQTWISKNGAAPTTKHDATAGAHAALGYYRVKLDDTDTGTAGNLEVMVYVPGYLRCKKTALVLASKPYSSLVAGTDNLETDTVQWLGTAAHAATVAGVPVVQLHASDGGGGINAPANFEDLNITDTTGLVRPDMANASGNYGGTVATVTTLTNAVTLANGAHGGAAATLTLLSAAITNTNGSALTLTSSGGNGSGLVLAGNGSGHGLLSTAGATGHGVYSLGGATSGDGIHAEGPLLGFGMYLKAVGTSKDGLYAEGYTGGSFKSTATNGVGLMGIGNGSNGCGILGRCDDGYGIEAYSDNADGVGFRVRNAQGVAVQIAGKTIGLDIDATAGPAVDVDGTTGGLQINASGGNAVALSADGGNGDGINVRANGSGDGMNLLGGATGHGIYCLAGAEGSGMVLGGYGAGHGLWLSAAGTGDGLYAKGGATSGHGINALAQTLGDGIRAVGAGAGSYDVNADIHGTVDTVTTLTTWDKTGYALADTTSDGVIADAVWNAATATYGGTGSYGLLVETDIDAAVSSRSSHTAASVAALILSTPANKLVTDASGYAAADLVAIHGTALTETDGQLAAAFVKFFNVLTPTLTCAGVDQTGDSFGVVSSVTYGNNALLTAIGTRAAASTALSNVTWTDAKAAFLDAAISGRAPAATALTNVTWTDVRAGKLDNLDAAVTSRAAAATALTNITWTDTKAALIDAAVTSRAAAATALSNATWTDAKAAFLDAAITGRAPAATALSNATWTDARAAKLDNLDATISSRLAPAGTLARVTLTDTATTLTNAPLDSAGTTTLLGRLSDARATKLDHLDADVSTRAAPADVQIVVP